MSRLLRALYGQAWLLLGATTLLWAGNSVASRMIAGEMSPMAVVFFRWFFVCAILAVARPPTWRGMAADLAAHWRRIALMGALGFTGFNVLFYIAAYHTSAINLTLLQTSIPIFVLAGAAGMGGARIGGPQLLGMAAATFGVILVATRGEPARILELRLNFGDALVLVACVLYAGYTLALRSRPAGAALAFFAALAAAAFVSSAPFILAEWAAGQTYWPSLKGWLLLAYIALGPSLIAQIFYMRGVELIGPGRAGVYANLVPVFGALLAVGMLGEEFHIYHLTALALGLGGIWLSQMEPRTAAAAPEAEVEKA